MTLNSLKQLIIRNRSYRRFLQKPRPGHERLEAWLELARLTASGGNCQRLRYALVTQPEACAALFPQTAWAGRLKNWSPTPQEAPTAYVLVLAAADGPTPHADAGIAMQTMLLAAAADGFGGCMLGSINRPEISKLFGLPAELEVLYVVAFGKPSETCLLKTAVDDEVAYYRGDDDVHYVPKLPLARLIIPCK